MHKPDPNSVKQRIIAMKREDPTRKPAQIAKALGCKRSYAIRVLVDMLMTGDYAGEHDPVPQKLAHQCASGRRHPGGYTKLL